MKAWQVLILVMAIVFFFLLALRGFQLSRESPCTVDAPPYGANLLVGETYIISFECQGYETNVDLYLEYTDLEDKMKGEDVIMKNVLSKQGRVYWQPNACVGPSSLATIVVKVKGSGEMGRSGKFSIICDEG